MNKEQLIALGLTDEQANQVISGYGAMIPKERFDEVNNSKKLLEEQITDRDNQLKELSKNAEVSDVLKADIVKLQEDNKQAKEKYDADVKQIKVDSAVELALTNAKARNLTAAKSLLDLSNVELDDQGKVKGLEDKIKALTEDEGTKFMFEPNTVQISGVLPGGAPNQGAHSVDTSKMSYSELANYMAANPGVEI
ncbi:phage scaffolding protein [Viridibacillus arvi]|uniref:phage scaffolding protein n=1 Tax=Viridibacillus arvi TaxID=263475 RepID=UPI003D2AC338